MSAGDAVREPHRPTIKEWPEDERPREKVIRKGVRALSDAELVAILIRSGTGRRTALDLARTIVADGGGLRPLAERNADELMRLKGIGSAKAVGLLAAFEIGRRVHASTDAKRPVLSSPQDVAGLMIPRLRGCPVETFTVLVLDSKNALKREVELTKGTLNASLVHPREVFKVAIDSLAASIIVVHNHPSGNPEPSREDLDVTRQLVESGRTLGIPLHDHIIVAGDRFCSLAERGLL